MYVQLKMYALCSIYLEATGYVRPTRVHRKLFLDIQRCDTKKIHCAQGELTLFLNDYFCVNNMLKQHIMLF